MGDQAHTKKKIKNSRRFLFMDSLILPTKMRTSFHTQEKKNFDKIFFS